MMKDRIHDLRRGRAGRDVLPVTRCRAARPWRLFPASSCGVDELWFQASLRVQQFRCKRLVKFCSGPRSGRKKRTILELEQRSICSICLHGLASCGTFFFRGLHLLLNE